MPVVNLSHNGLTAGIPPVKKNLNPPKRGIISGWSQSASRRNIAFLRSVRPDSLTGESFALTLTIRNCPASPSDWHKLRRSFIKRLERRGLVRLHWVTEWQSRGVPHLHGIAFFPEGVMNSFDLITQWLEVARPYVCNRKAQDVKPVSHVIGWFQYLSKHAARGYQHYQRNSENIPDKWKAKTGRVWGYVGDWVTDKPIRIELTSNEAFYVFRRLARSWRIADARSHPVAVYSDNHVLMAYIPDKKRIGMAKHCLKCNDAKKSRYMGVNEWISLELGLLFCDYLRSEGYGVEC